MITELLAAITHQALEEDGVSPGVRAILSYPVGVLVCVRVCLCVYTQNKSIDGIR